MTGRHVDRWCATGFGEGDLWGRRTWRWSLRRSTRHAELVFSDVVTERAGGDGRNCRLELSAGGMRVCEASLVKQRRDGHTPAGVWGSMQNPVRYWTPDEENG
jgi:hypothetical protein